MASGHDVRNDASFNVREPEIATTITIRQPFMIDPQLVQHGGVKVMRMDCVRGCQNAVFIGLTIDDATFDAASSHP